ncbi:MAG: extracellular solute-binding protein [Limnochordia bacterium]|jgi:ABC-type glycerol-3-phosphate transport system substrate-binding protein
MYRAFRRCAGLLWVMICMVQIIGIGAGAKTASIELWVPAKPLWLDDAKAMFEEEYSEYCVNITALNWNTIVEKTTVAIAAGAPPDVFTYGTGGVVNYAAIGVLQPVDKIAPPELIKDMWPGFLEPAMWKGQLYGLPFLGDTAHLLYSAIRFEESGLDVNQPPVTWEELVAMGRKAVRRDSGGRMTVTGFYLPVNVGSTEHVFATFLRQLGGQHFSDDGSQALFNSPEGVQGMEFYVSLIHEHAITEIGAPSDVLKGSAAMAWTGGPSSIVRMRGLDPELALNVRGAALPWFKHRLYFTGGQTFMIPVGAKEPEGAAELINFLTGPSVAPMAAEAGNFFPRQSLLRTVYSKADYDLRTIIAVMEFAATSPPHPQWVKTIPEMQTQIMRALRRETTPKEAVDTLTRIVNGFIAEAEGK